MMYQFTKDPDALLDYTVDWTPWLDTGETISTHAIELAPSGGSLTCPTNSHSPTAVTVWLDNGVVGETYTVTTRITTNLGRTDDRSFRVVIRQT